MAAPSLEGSQEILAVKFSPRRGGRMRITREDIGDPPAVSFHTATGSNGDEPTTASSTVSADRTIWQRHVPPGWRWAGLACVLVVGTVSLAVVANHEMSPAVFASLCWTAPSPDAAEATFLTENDAAMREMMKGMTIRPTGDVDADFARLMIPHHQAAIEMGQALLRHGHNEKLRRLAQEIIVTQQQEIAAMQLAIGSPLSPSAAAPDQAIH